MVNGLEEGRMRFSSILDSGATASMTPPVICRQAIRHNSDVGLECYVLGTWVKRGTPGAMYFARQAL